MTEIHQVGFSSSTGTVPDVGTGIFSLAPFTVPVPGIVGTVVSYRPVFQYGTVPLVVVK
jgi:hypothetical protein